MSLQKITSAFIAGSKWGYQSAEKVRQSVNSIAGLRTQQWMTHGVKASDWYYAAVAATAEDHPDKFEQLIDWTEMASGWTVEFRYWRKVETVSGSLTVRVRNVTDSVNYDAAAAYTSVTDAESTITIPVPAVVGLKRYKLQYLMNSTSIGFNVRGCLEIYG